MPNKAPQMARPLSPDLLVCKKGQKTRNESCEGKFEEGLCKGERAIKSAVKLQRVPAAGCYSAEHPPRGRVVGD